MENYVKKAMRTYDNKAEQRLIKILLKKHQDDDHRDIAGLLFACLGMSGELGEFIELVKKWIFHEKDLDEEHLKKEMGDFLWYVALVCNSMGWDLNDIMDLNIRKLEKRYPEGFDLDKCNHRKEGDI